MVSRHRINALVTGGAKRIGAAICADLSAHGFGVAIHYNQSSEAAQALSDELNAKGGTTCVVQGDLTNSAQTQQIIAQASAQLGPIQLLINNASSFENDDVRAIDEAIWDRHFAIHVKAPALLAQAFHQQIALNSHGLIVNLIDQRVWALTPRFFSYTLSKSALWTATQTMAQALAPNIRVNAIGPGPTLANERQLAQDFAAQSQATILQKGPDLSEFGATIRYMWESPSLTGQMIALDGGQHLAWETPDITSANE